MGEITPEVPGDADEKMADAGAGVSGPPQKKVLIIHRPDKTRIAVPKITDPKTTRVVTIKNK